MSRIGKKPIPIPPGVEVVVSGNNLVNVKKGNKELSREFNKNLIIKVEDAKVIVERTSDDKQFRALHGLTRSLIANMVQGVETGFVKTLELVGVGYRATKQGSKLVLSVGYSHPVEFSSIDGIDFEVETPTKLHIKGIDKQLVGQVAANIRSVREPEPYKGKGIKYSNEVIRRKAGKTGKKK